MGRKKDLTTTQREEIFGLRKVGLSLSKVSDMIGCGCLTISKLCSSYKEQSQITHKRNNGGRKKKLDKMGVHQLKWVVKKKRNISLA